MDGERRPIKSTLRDGETVLQLRCNGHQTRGTSTPGTIGDSPWRVGVPVKLGASARVEARLSALRPMTIKLKGMRMIAEIVAAFGKVLRDMRCLSKGFILGQSN